MKVLWVFLQIATIPFIWLIKVIFRIKIIHENTVPPEKGCLMISTHESKIDPFYILNYYGLWKTVVNVPYRFPVMHEYMEKKIIGHIISCFGGYDIGDTFEKKAKILFYTRKIIEEKGSLVIFPEGRIIKGDHDFVHFQNGYRFLLTESTQVILVKMHNIHALLSTFFSRKRPYIIYRTIPSSVPSKEALKIIEQFYSHA